MTNRERAKEVVEGGKCGRTTDEIYDYLVQAVEAALDAVRDEAIEECWKTVDVIMRTKFGLMEGADDDEFRQLDNDIAVLETALDSIRALRGGKRES